MVRNVLASKVDTTITVIAKYGGIHTPKGGNYGGWTLLLTNVISATKREPICKHLWSYVDNNTKYNHMVKGDTVLVEGKVVKYLKYGGEKPQKDFSIDILSCEKVDI